MSLEDLIPNAEETNIADLLKVLEAPTLAPNPNLTYFKVTFKLIKATDLPIDDNGNAPSTYCLVEWDKFKYFKTEVAKSRSYLMDDLSQKINAYAIIYSFGFAYPSFVKLTQKIEHSPTWKLTKEFYYSTLYSDRMEKKSVDLRVFTKDDIEIGTASIDLLSIAAGPILHTLHLSTGLDYDLVNKNNKSAGATAAAAIRSVATGSMKKIESKITVEVEMEQLTDFCIRLEDMQLTSFRVSPKLKLVFTYGRHLPHQKPWKSTEPIEVRPDTIKWEDMDILFHTSLPDFETQFFTIHAHKKSVDFASPHFHNVNIKVPFSHVIHKTGIKTFAIPFEETLKHGETVIAKFSCNLVISGYPHFCQLVGGVHTDSGISGSFRYQGFLPPPGYKADDVQILHVRTIGNGGVDTRQAVSAFNHRLLSARSLSSIPLRSSSSSTDVQSSTSTSPETPTKNSRSKVKIRSPSEFPSTSASAPTSPVSNQKSGDAPAVPPKKKKSKNHVRIKSAASNNEEQSTVASPSSPSPSSPSQQSQQVQDPPQEPQQSSNDKS